MLVRKKSLRTNNIELKELLFIILQVIWQRRYHDNHINILTIDRDTFINDLRIRSIAKAVDSQNDDQVKQNRKAFEWNLQIRKLNKNDSAFYYCLSGVLCSQPIKLNVLCESSWRFNLLLGRLIIKIYLYSQLDTLKRNQHRWQRKGFCQR